MNIMQSSFEPLEYEYGEELKHIERIGRLAYKSEDKISEDDSSAKSFVMMLVNKGHLAAIEHASLCYEVDKKTYEDFRWAMNQYEDDHHKKCFLRGTDYPPRIPAYNCLASIVHHRYVISGNLRAWYEFLKWSLPPAYESKSNDLMKDINRLWEIFGKVSSISEDECQDGRFIRHIDPKTLTRQERLVHQDVSIKITCDRGVTHEIVRHRPPSYLQESTRFCNYSLGKFGTSISVIDLASGMRIEGRYSEQGAVRDVVYDKILDEWQLAMEDAEKHYLKMIELGASPQIARSVLPNSTKTEIVMTSNLAEWEWFFKLRTDKAAHPQMREITIPLYDYFIENVFYEEVNK